LRSIYKDKEVRTIIVKLSLINLNNKEFKIGPLTSVPLKSFENEVKIQTDIFNKTIDHLDPICPSIVYSNHYNSSISSDKNKLLKKILYIIRDKVKHQVLLHKLISDIMSKLSQNKKENIHSFGLIGMEMMDDYTTLYKVNNSYKDVYELIARLRLIELAVKTGYTHSDYHQGNILVSPNMSGYYGSKIGHVILIDFGYTKKIPDEILDAIRKMYEENNFYGILDVFYNEDALSNTFPNSSDTYSFSEYPDLYSWIMPSENLMKSMNDEMLLLKNAYIEYEKKVEKVSLGNKALFSYGKVEEKKEEVEEKKYVDVIPPVEEHVKQVQVKPIQVKPNEANPVQVKQYVFEGKRKEISPAIGGKSKQTKRKNKQSKHKQTKRKNKQTKRK